MYILFDIFLWLLSFTDLITSKILALDSLLTPSRLNNQFNKMKQKKVKKLLLIWENPEQYINSSWTLK